MIPQPSYPSKVMLVGEYGVILGGSALTIPLHCFRASVRNVKDIPEGKTEEATRSLAYLRELYEHICGIPETAFHARPDIKGFQKDMERYWLDMNIPTGYGLGSSGAVSAAIYDCFFPAARACSLTQQKEDLATIESFFHGLSSGVDALTSYLDAGLHIREDGSIQRTSFRPADTPGGYRFFLLDSGERYDTSPLVKRFLEQMKDPVFASEIRMEYLPVNQKLIQSLLGERDADPALLVRIISDFQFTHFRSMIPESALDLWIEGQVSNEYYLKLNGSGGGYMLGIAHENAQETLQEKWKQSIIWIE